ncbi:MAG: Fur family transcriptional regulator [Thermodesulfobacteriota bacterium]|nr:Fur family transcriptional regulator [Thermodesulfobacteriota bacterium]
MRQEEDEFGNYLKKQGLKFTPERAVVLEKVLSFKKHFNADDLYERIHKYNKKISRATVYRVIPLFVESGLIIETLRCQGRVSYERVIGFEHHDHMVCLGCGKIIEFKDDRLEEIQAQVCKKYEFKQVEHRLGIRGYCKECVAKGLDKG